MRNYMRLETWSGKLTISRELSQFLCIQSLALQSLHLKQFYALIGSYAQEDTSSHFIPVRHVRVSQYCPEVNQQYKNIFRVHPVIIARGPPPFCTNSLQIQMDFICNLILESRLNKVCNPKPWQEEVGDCPGLDEPRLQP